MMDESEIIDGNPRGKEREQGRAMTAQYLEASTDGSPKAHSVAAHSPEPRGLRSYCSNSQSRTLQAQVVLMKTSPDLKD